MQVDARASYCRWHAIASAQWLSCWWRGNSSSAVSVMCVGANGIRSWVTWSRDEHDVCTWTCQDMIHAANTVTCNMMMMMEVSTKKWQVTTWSGMSCNAVACHVMQWHVMSCSGMSWNAVACHVMQWHVMSCSGMLWNAVACHVMQWHVM